MFNIITAEQQQRKRTEMIVVMMITGHQNMTRKGNEIWGSGKK
jgi:hypothetical protein